MENAKELKIPYKPKTGNAIKMIALFGSLTIFMGFMAATNTMGLIIGGIIELTTDQATLFYVLLTLLMALLLSGGIWSLAQSRVSKTEIVITEEGISAPKHAFSKKLVFIPFEGIIDTKLRKVQKQQFLRIKYQGGNLNIAHNMLPDVDAFDKVVKLVHAGMDAASEKATK